MVLDYDEIATNRQEFWRTVKDTYHEGNSHDVVYRRKAFAELVKKNEVTSILELGCNSGGNLLYILRDSPKIKAVGLDINDRAIKHGKEVEQNKADLQVGSIYDLSRFKDSSFDMVFTCTCLLHVPHLKVAGILEEMVRIAKLYTVNIESHGEDAVRTYAGKVPHSFVHNYTGRLSEYQPQVVDMSSITGHKPQGGADNFVWTNLTDRQLDIKIGG